MGIRRPLSITAAACLALSAGCGGSGDGGGHGRTAASAQPPARGAADIPAGRPRPPAEPPGRPVPILMYHVIAAAPADTPYPELWVPAATFRSQMRALAAAGYHGVTLQQAWNYWKRGRYLPRQPVVVSFDDGYLSQYTGALPVLRALRWPGVLNLKVGNIGNDGLPRGKVGKLVAAGWEIDAHTITHPNLTTVGPAQLRREIAGSRAELRRMFHVPVNFFCYPAGRYDASVVAAVRAAGYLAATTVNPGYASPRRPFELARVRVDPGDGVAGLRKKLRALKGTTGAAAAGRSSGGVGG
jgi:peptidoglycan/xylan/chitin deacetylase (PgdA/CDA1 family)